MSPRCTVGWDDDQTRAMEVLAARYGITEDEVIKQLVDMGLESLEQRPA